MSVSVFIFGSCVSRDALWMSQGHNLEHAEYFARTSCATAFSSEKFAIGIEELEREHQFANRFRRNMVERDITRALPAALSKTAYDFLLVDFVDDRYPLIEVDSTAALLSAELMDTGIQAKPNARRIEPETAEHFERWAAGFESLCRLVDPRKILINEVYMATSDSSGAPLNKSWVAGFNDVLRKRYDFCARQGSGRITYDPSLFVAYPEHKWGVAPFHYIPKLYEQTTRAVSEAYVSAT